MLGASPRQIQRGDDVGQIIKHANSLTQVARWTSRHSAAMTAGLEWVLVLT